MTARRFAWSVFYGFFFSFIFTTPLWANDPDIEPGFPVSALHSTGGAPSGNYHAGPAIHTLVGNIDDNAKLEILVSSMSVGPLNAWHADGVVVSGFPIATSGASGYGAPYAALAQLTSHRGLEIVLGTVGLPGQIAAYDGSGTLLWSMNSANNVSTPPAAANLTGSLWDEVALGEEDGKLHVYDNLGQAVPPFPVSAAFYSQERHTPSFADIDGDGDREIFTVTGTGNDLASLLGYHHDGTMVNGFPFLLNRAYVDTFIAIGNVDADPAYELVLVGKPQSSPWHAQILIISATGQLKQQISTGAAVFYGSAPALTDLDGDGQAEIIVQTNGTLEVWKGDGTLFPGWPISFSGYWMGNSAPVVGDVDGDLEPDIVITLQVAGSSEYGEVRVYDRFGNLHPHFPKVLPIGSGAVPAIADIDRDRRNEIIVSGNYWNGSTGFYPKVWVYDLGETHHGAIHWGQFGHDAQHQGFYKNP